MDAQASKVLSKLEQTRQENGDLQVGIHKLLEDLLFKYISRAGRMRYLTLKRSLLGGEVRYSVHEKAPLMIAECGPDRLVFCRPERAGLYRRGIDRRVSRLEKSYMLTTLPETLQGVFIDCGANIGELGRFARRRGLDYHAFEPEALEADCCDFNNFGGKAQTNRKALWNEETVLKFYSKPTTADSSLIEMEDFTSVKEIPTTTLDAYIAAQGITHIAVMKIEAEGAEPEILEGAQKALAIADYVTVDCGFERGFKQESTLPPVTNFLLARGFILDNWNREWNRFLYKCLS